MRIFNLNAELSYILYKILLKGNSSRGYDIITMKMILPVIENIESNFEKELDTGVAGLRRDAVISFKMEENIFDMIVKMVQLSTGWQADKTGRLVVILDLFLKTVPSAPAEVPDASK